MAVSKITSGCTALSPALERFETAPLALLAQRKLLRRTVSKYLLPASDLDGILPGLEADYQVLRAGRGGLARYHTIYFDTPDLKCFHDHRRGRRPRQKVRIRSYPDRSITFLEVKTRKSPIVSSKQRLELPFGTETIDEASQAFLGDHARLPIEALEEQVRIDFERVTLLGVAEEERITLDVGLAFTRGETTLRFGAVGIVEVKQASYSSRSPVLRALKRAGQRPTSVSKYCTALALTHEGLRKNRFLRVLRTLERMTA